MHALPEVFLGADAVAGLDGSLGFLYGEKRHRHVDVLGFEPADPSRGSQVLEVLVQGRLDRSEIRGWRIVGVAVAMADVDRGEETLLEGLVAGDVVIAAGVPSAAAAAPGRRPALRILVHRGDCLAELRNPSASGSERRPPAGIAGRSDAKRR